MFMKTSVPYSYKFLILAWAIPGSSIILKESSLTIERFTKEQTICISTAPNMQFGSLRDLRSKEKKIKYKTTKMTEAFWFGSTDRPEWQWEKTK